MLTLQIDPVKLDRFLKMRNITLKDISSRLVIEHHPSTGVITSWLDHRPVTATWRKAICEHFNCEQCDLFDTKGRITKHGLLTFNLNPKSLSRVTIHESVTPSAISEWRGGGGITYSKLIALAKMLGIVPLHLLSTTSLHELSHICGIDFVAPVF